MKIEISDNVLMQAALGKVEEGEYFDALCLFARIDSYESALNQIGCLCELRDVGYAIDLYRKLLANFCFTHNVYTDVRSLGDATEILMAYFGNEPKGEFLLQDDNKYTAKEELLGYYPVDFDESLFGMEDIDYLADTLSEGFNDTHKSMFYDVKSTDYFRNVRIRMEKAYVDGNFAKGRELQRQYLEIDTDDLETLEVQLFLCLTQQQWKAGVKYALKVANKSDATYRVMGAAAQILARVEGYEDVCFQLLNKLVEYGEEISDVEMMDYVQIAATKLGYGELTLNLCNILYSHYKDAGCSALNLCARVYLNCRQQQKAREAVLTLLRAVPWDSAAVTLLSYVNNGVVLQLDNVSGYNSLARHFDVPTQLSVVAQYSVLKQLEEKQYALAIDNYPYIDCLSKLCVSEIVKGNAEKFLSEAMVLSAIINSVDPVDKDSFVRLLKEQLCKPLPEPTVNKDFLAKLISLQCKDKVLIALNRGFYTLNLSTLTLAKDKTFVAAFSLCATLRKIDVKRLEKAYKSFKAIYDKQLGDDADAARQLAYCLLAMGYKTFAQSNESAYFGEDERLLYEAVNKIINPTTLTSK